MDRSNSFAMKWLSMIALSLCSHFIFAQQKPNIVIIISDDHAYQTIGAYGSKYAKTPSIDRIANEGAIFNKAYVTNSICGPSRATILTGKYSHKNGFKDNETSEFNHGQELFSKYLQKAGYKTAWIGKQHLGNKPEGFDDFSILVEQGHYFNSDFINSDGTRECSNGYVSDVITDKATKWLDQRQQDQPVCLVIGHKATHRTWMPDPQDFGTYDQTKFEIPQTFYDAYTNRIAASKQEMSIGKDMRMGYDLKMFTGDEKNKDGNFTRMTDAQLTAYKTYYDPIYAELKEKNPVGKALAEWKFNRYMTDYLNTAHSLDRNIGKVLDYLDAHKMTDNTLIIYMSDQGFYMGEHGWFDKRFMYEESFRTPMVARFPKLIKPNTQIDGMVMNVDIAPTILELAGIAVPADMQGKSFLPILKNSKTEVRKNMYYHYYEKGEHAVSPHFGISDGRYKLIRFYGGVEAWELYDLEKDKQEMQNVYGQKSYRSIQNRLLKLLTAEANKLEDTDALKILATKLK